MVKGCGFSSSVYAFAIFFAAFLWYPVTHAGHQPQTNQTELHAADQVPLPSEFYFTEDPSKLLEKNDIKEKKTDKNQTLINHISSLVTLQCSVRIVQNKSVAYCSEAFPVFLLQRNFRL
jgi:hypothetical protein